MSQSFKCFIVFCIIVFQFSYEAKSQTSLGLTRQASVDFVTGKALFEKIWVSSPSSTTASDGLGPYYNSRSCAQCHQENTVVMQLDDEIYGNQLQTFAVPGLKAEGQLIISYIENIVEFGDETLVQHLPQYSLVNLQFGELSSPVRSLRRASSLAGIGLLASIPDETILALADENDNDNNGISGRAVKLWDPVNQTELLGRFGWKASQPNLEQQIARAFNLDLGLSNAIYQNPYGDCTPTQLDCLQMPNGNSVQHDDLEASHQLLDSILFYVKNIAAPIPIEVDSPKVINGKIAFIEAGCGSCHQPSYDNLGYSFSPYSDLLLHDMGEGLADKYNGEDVSPTEASVSEWRTAPLWGLKERQAFLHDGRAKSIKEAIIWHDGEAKQSITRFRSMNSEQRDDLISFLRSL